MHAPFPPISNHMPPGPMFHWMNVNGMRFNEDRTTCNIQIKKEDRNGTGLRSTFVFDLRLSVKQICSFISNAEPESLPSWEFKVLPFKIWCTLYITNAASDEVILRRGHFELFRFCYFIFVNYVLPAIFTIKWEIMVHAKCNTVVKMA